MLELLNALQDPNPETCAENHCIGDSSGLICPLLDLGKLCGSPIFLSLSTHHLLVLFSSIDFFSVQYPQGEV
jgi:hypothetical protein